MKTTIHFVYFLFLMLACAPNAQSADTVRVVTHKAATIVTDPAQGFKLYKAWGEFPAATEPIRQIKLKLKLACPNEFRCADWDYKDHITIRRTGGVGGTSQDFEIGRMLTPYGGAFGRGWQFNWEVDVTDFSMLLRDSVEIEYNHTGYEPSEDRGWSLSLEFEIIRGKAAWEPIAIQKIYDGSFRYGDSANSIENSLKPVSFAAAKSAHMARLRVVQTGHGMDRPDGCGEFCNKYREVWFDGKMLDRRAVWKKCGDNPLYPQAGTWIYDRAAWCPGDLVQPDLYELPVQPGKQHTIDINMQAYNAVNPSADEVITAYLVQYKKAAAAHDVRINDIVVPSGKDARRRHNPATMQPTVVVQNMGSETMRTVQVKYGTKGFAPQTYTWRGTLLPAATQTVTLPGIIRSHAGTNTYEVELLKPNGKQDGNQSDNLLTNFFTAAPRHDSLLVVYLLTNNQPAHNSYSLTNSKGDTVAKRALGSLAANQLYPDTVRLGQGMYRFVFLDTADNGLEFWANARGGRGKLRLLNGTGAMLKDFESDFGSSVQYDFEVGPTPDAVKNEMSFGLYPTRTQDKTTFDFYANNPQDVVVQLVTDPGEQVVESHHYTQLKEGLFTYDLSRYPKGRFYLVVTIGGKEQFRKRIRHKE